MALFPSSKRGGGTDYSTTEVDTGVKWIDGKTIYRKVIPFGKMPNAALKSVAHGITGIDKVIDQWGFGLLGSNYTVFPYVTFNSDYNVSLFSTATNVCIETKQNRSGVDAWVIMEYTKS